MVVETWGVIQQKKSYLITWEQETSRKIYGPIKLINVKVSRDRPRWPKGFRAV